MADGTGNPVQGGGTQNLSGVVFQLQLIAQGQQQIIGNLTQINATLGNLTIGGGGSGNATIVASVSALRSLSVANVTAGSPAYVESYYGNATGVAGRTYTLHTGNATENGGLTILSNTAGHYWTLNVDNGPLQPEWFGAVRGNVTAATYYGNLTQIQAVYPFATSTTNQLDWLGAQSCFNYIYSSQIGNATTNATVGAVQFNGNYTYDQELICNAASCKITGVSPGLSQFVGMGATAFNYIGVAGNLTTSKFILHCYDTTEFLGAPPGHVNGPGLSSAKYEIEGITFNNGIGGSMTGNQSASNYVTGLRLGTAQQCKVSNCNFVGTLYDGIIASGQQLFLELTRNEFYGVQRDAISIAKCFAGSGYYSTTVWIYRNEFGFVGRYGIIMFSSTGAFPIIKDNDFEFAFSNSFYVLNPSWFVNGLVAGCCFVGCNNMVFTANRFEGVSATAGYWADVHLINCTPATISDSDFQGLAITAMGTTVGNGTSPGLTQAGTDYIAANGYLDQTDQRNFNVGWSGNVSTSTQGQNLVVRNIPNLAKVWSAGGGFGLLQNNQGNAFEDVYFSFMDIPTFAGTYIRQVDPIGNASVTVMYPFDYLFTARNTAIVTGIGFPFPMKLQSFDGGGQNGAFFQSEPVVSVGGRWVGNTSYSSNISVLGLGCFVLPTLANENGYYYQCIVAGNTSGSEPTWSSHQTPGGNFTDGGVTWMCVDKINFTSVNNGGTDPNTSKSGMMIDGQRYFKGDAAPTGGWYTYGDKEVIRIPSPSGNEGWICTTPTPNLVFKTYGSIGA